MCDVLDRYAGAAERVWHHEVALEQGLDVDVARVQASEVPVGLGPSAYFATNDLRPANSLVVKPLTPGPARNLTRRRLPRSALA